MISVIRRVSARAASSSLIGLAIALASACGEPDPVGPGLQHPPLHAIVSDPAPMGGVVAASGALGAPAAVPGTEGVYVSLEPGSLDEATVVDVRNRGSGDSELIPVVNGGFDPVRIPGSAGDTIDFAVSIPSIRPYEWPEIVPLSSPPTIVRSEPSRGKRDVPVALSILVVFSEPMDSTTLDSATVQLRRDGDVVPGRVEVTDDWIAQFTPSAPLAPGATYELAVTGEVRDLDGESLESALTITFTTVVDSPSTHSLGNIAVSVTSSGADLPTDGYRIAVDKDASHTIGTNDALTLPDVRAGSHVVELLDVASNCTVAIPNPQTVFVEFGETMPVSFTVTCVPVMQLPSGTQLAFMRNGHVIVKEGSQEVQLTIGVDPAWSPDGERIAFARLDARSRSDIYVMDANGSNIVRRTVGFGVPDIRGYPLSGFHHPTWSPDGSKLAVASGHLYEGGIYLLSAADNGEGPILIRDMAASPAWSPDGSKIAFASLSGDDGYQALHVMNADGSDVRDVTRRDEGGIESLTWSPDGGRIAFAKCMAGSCDVHVVSEDGSDLTQLTHVGTAVNPAWSLDGAWIAFTLGARIAFVAPDTAGDSITVMGPGTNPAWRP